MLREGQVIFKESTWHYAIFFLCFNTAARTFFLTRNLNSLEVNRRTQPAKLHAVCSAVHPNDFVTLPNSGRTDYPGFWSPSMTTVKREVGTKWKKVVSR